MVTTILRGGLGNVLFQMSQCIAHAIHYDFDYCIPLHNENPHYKDQKPYIFPKIKYCHDSQNLTRYGEPHFHYHDVPEIDNVCFDGYWQSYRYFGALSKIIFNLFEFDKIETNKGVCGIHVRRGDYLLYPNVHPVVTPVYLVSAIMIMSMVGYRKFRVYSNDISWCRNFFGTQELFGDLSFEFPENADELQDMKSLAACESQIISNSTFSWWAAMINPHQSKTVVAPKKWFGSAVSHDIKDLIPSNWQMI